jgi:NAD(P)H dehydrogenase (quinone)
MYGPKQECRIAWRWERLEVLCLERLSGGDPDMIRKKFLITGATGSMGRSAVASVIKQGFAVRALVGKENERTAKLSGAGAQIAVGDVLEGVDAYFVYPIVPHLIEASAYFRQTSKQAGVDAIANTSQITARRDSNSHVARDHERRSRYSSTTYFLRVRLFSALNHHLHLTRRSDRLPVREWSVRTHYSRIFGPADRGDPVGSEATRGKTYSLRAPVETDHFALDETLGRSVKYQLSRSMSGVNRICCRLSWCSLSALSQSGSPSKRSCKSR